MDIQGSFSSRILIKLDQTLDYIPLASTISNAVNLIVKTILKTQDKTVINRNHYYAYLTEKSFKNTLFLIIPFVGNFIVYRYQSVNKQDPRVQLKAKDLLEEGKKELVNENYVLAYRKLYQSYKYGNVEAAAALGDLYHLKKEKKMGELKQKNLSSSQKIKIERKVDLYKSKATKWFNLAVFENRNQPSISVNMKYYLDEDILFGIALSQGNTPILNNMLMKSPRPTE